MVRTADARVERRRSQRVVEKKPVTSSSPAVSNVRRTTSRTLRSSGAKLRNDNEGPAPPTSPTDDDKTNDAAEMEATVTGTSDGKDKVVPKIRGVKRETSNRPAVPLVNVGEEEEERRSTEENLTATTPTPTGLAAPEEKADDDAQDEAKSTFLDKAFGLRRSRSPSNSPDAAKKQPVRKIELGSDSGVDSDSTTSVSVVVSDPHPPPLSLPTGDTATATTPSEVDQLGVKVAKASNVEVIEVDLDAPVLATTTPNPPTETTGEETPATSTPTPQLPGKLRSSVADEEGNALARGYRKSLRDIEEYSLDYISKEVHHPVISCFRELSRADVSQIVGNSKLKKSCSSLEQSVIYLGLIDLMATANNNPFYGENCNAKFSKNVSGMVQRILLEFKNIIGMWALSGNDQLNYRYTLIINYLRLLVPMFNKAGFDKEFNSIIDSIENEVARRKSSHDKLTGMSSLTEDQEQRPTLGEIFLNVSLDVKDDLTDDDEDVVKIESSTPKIFGKPIQTSRSPFNQNKRKVKKTKTLKSLVEQPNDVFIIGGEGGSLNRKQPNEIKSSSFHNPARVNLLSQQPKGLTFQTVAPSSSKSTSEKKKTENKIVSAKRSATDELKSNNNDGTAKKRKLDESSSSSPISRNEKTKTTIKTFFQSASNSNPTTSSTLGGTVKDNILTPDAAKPKPTVNAFAIMMKRSRELAQQKRGTSTTKVLDVSLAKA